MTNCNFMEYVTGTAFNLSLSKQMCEALQWTLIARYNVIERGSFKVFFVPPNLLTMQALERRGLVSHKPIADLQDNPYCARTEKSRWVATPEGEKVFELLVMANLCDAITPKNKSAA